MVADRFHLLKNLVEVLEAYFPRHRSILKDAAVAVAEERAPPTPTVPSQDEMYRGKRASPQNWKHRLEEASLQRHADHVAACEQVHALREKGMAIAEIARQVGVARKTVYVYLRMPHPPERKRPMRNPKERVLAPYEPYLLKRWEEGCHNGLQLWRELVEQGYRYSRGSVARFVAQLRQDGPRAATRAAIASAPGPPARRVAFLVVQRPQQLDDEEALFLTHLRARDDEIKTVCQLSQDFAQMLRDRKGDRLAGWIEEASGSGVGELERFAAGLRADEAAVQAGLTLIWSNAQVEGHVNRLKLIKRAMYGRGNFDLLRQRVLHAA
jgi:transposase